MAILSGIGIIVGIVLICILAYRGITPVFGAAIAGVLICVASGIDLTTGMTTYYATGAANMFKGLCLTMLGCMLFGKIMNKNGSSCAIAYFIRDHLPIKYAPIICQLITAVLCIGGMGVGAMVVVIPIGLLLFSEAGYTKDILCASIMGGMWTYCLVCPMMPSINNALLIETLGEYGVTASSGLIPGWAAGIAIMIANFWYVQWQAVHWKKHGRVFCDWDDLNDVGTDRKDTPPLAIAVIPVIVVLVCFNVFGFHLALSLFIGTVVAIVLRLRTCSPTEWMSTLSQASAESVPLVVNIAVMGGIGGIVGNTPFFQWLLDWMSNSSINPYVLATVSGSLCAAAVGSSSTAIGTVIPLLRPFLEQSMSAGFDMGNVGRLVALASIGPDSLPHNGSIIAQIQMCKSDHKHSYWPICVVTVINTTLACYLIALPLAILGFQ